MSHTISLLWFIALVVKWHDSGDSSVMFVEGLQNPSRTSRNASPQHQVDSHALERLGGARIAMKFLFRVKCVLL